MLRISSAVAVMLALACAFLLYKVSYDTRQIEVGVQAQERRLERLRSDIAVLRAELAYISRPERIEPFARALGLEPARGEQYLTSQSPTANGSGADARGNRTAGSAYNEGRVRDNISPSNSAWRSRSRASSARAVELEPRTSSGA